MAGITGHDSLPAQLTSFVGRRQELAEVERDLGKQRLVTLTGPGGSGKTRLAVEVARRWAERQKRSVCFIDLAAVTDPDEVPQALAVAAGIQNMNRRPVTELLVLNLRDSDHLILLDNCEHLVRACADLAATLVHGCPNLRLLCTSRERLRVPGEVTRHLPPLTLPDPGVELDSEWSVRYDAMRLFVERARLGSPDFKVGPSDVAVVARICQQLDGLPLAIELAAARATLLGVDDILARLRDRFSVLTDSDRLAVPRHRTLQAAVAWSYDLLDEAERSAFVRLSVFSGGFDVPAAEAILPGAPISGAILDVLGRLVDKSLIATERLDDGSIRFRLLETLRQYAADRMAELGSVDQIRGSHARYFLTLAGELGRRRTPEAYQRLDRELANLRSALSWSVLHEDEPCQWVLELGPYWGGRGLAAEGRAWLERALARSQRTRAAAGALAGASWLAQRQSDYDTCARYLTEAEAICRELGDERRLADVLLRRGDLARHRGQFAAACGLLEQALAVSQAVGDRHLAAMGRMMLGHARGYLGQLEIGKADLERSVRELADTGAAPVYIGHYLIWLAELELHEGHTLSAGRRLTEALAGMWALNDFYLVAHILDDLAWLAALKRDPVRAMRLGGAAERLRELTGTSPAQAFHERVEAVLAAARATLGSKSSRAWNEGRAMDRAQAVRYALEHVEWSASPSPPPASLRRRGNGGLTRREAEIARLVADGLTDSDIARQLGISQRTAEFHVERVRHKLGVTRRVQIATWVASGGGAGQA